MSAAREQDLRGLAALAQSKGPDLRATLLRLQTQSFRDAPSRTRAFVASYEAMALGLIPLVPETILAEIEEILRGVPETPDSIFQAFRALRHEAAPSDEFSALDAHALRERVIEARSDRPLAERLLRHADLSALDRAALYLFADEDARHAIRRDLDTKAALGGAPMPLLDAKSRALFLALARSGTLGGLAVALGLTLRIPPIRHLCFGHDAEAELFALCLVAAGLAPEDCTRVFLTADPELACSVPRVFYLSALCRTTSRGTALAIVRAALLDGGALGLAAGRDDERGRHPVPAGAQVRPRRAARDLSAKAESRPERDRDTSGRADHRATATTGRDRT